MINTIIKGFVSVPPAFYVTGLAFISLIIIMIKMRLIIKAPLSEFSMNSVKTLMRLVELSFVVLIVSLAVGLYCIKPGSNNWWLFSTFCFIPLFYAIKFCELIINNTDDPRTKKQKLGVMIEFIITALIIISVAVGLLLVSVELPPGPVLTLIIVIITLLIGRVLLD